MRFSTRSLLAIMVVVAIYSTVVVNSPRWGIAIASTGLSVALLVCSSLCFKRGHSKAGTIIAMLSVISIQLSSLILYAVLFKRVD